MERSVRNHAALVACALIVGLGTSGQGRIIHVDDATLGAEATSASQGRSGAISVSISPDEQVLVTAGWSAQAKYGGGGGTVEDPFLIGTAEQMNAVGLSPEDWDKHFRLVADIDMNDLGESTAHLIGTFQGVFDGDDHTIANLAYIIAGDEDASEGDYAVNFGLFRSMFGADAVVKDLGLVNPELRPASDCPKHVRSVGALVGLLSMGSVRNCFVEGGRVAGDESVGALVGFSAGEIRDCYTTGTVSGEKSTGGLVGEAFGSISDCWSGAEVFGEASTGGLVGKCRRSAVLSRCHAEGRVVGHTNAGGLVGSCSKECRIEDCFTRGSAFAAERVGGLVGYLEGSISQCASTAFVFADTDLGGLVGLNGGTVRASWAGGYVTGGRRAGGLVGFNWWEDRFLNYDPIVADSYATGRVRGEDFVGGLIGANQGGAVLRCYSTGAVTGLAEEAIVGGLVGANRDVLMEDSFWDIAMSGLDQSDGGIGKSTAEMQDLGTYVTVGWDFVDEAANGPNDVWKMCCDGPTYPRLAWERVSAEHGQQGARQIIFETMLDTPAGWMAEGQWEFGEPGGSGGAEHGHPDPTGGFTGANVYGVNLDGDYPLSVDGPHYLTAGPFDCRGYRDVHLQFAVAQYG
ncbi:MAG: hypothetical protein ACYTAS_16930 [Planctomycetota bacterium]|jgi:hypothetical protein